MSRPIREGHPSELTPVEKEIIAFTAQGLAAKEIAVKMKYSVHAIDAYRQRLMRIINVKNNCELVSWAYLKGVLKIPASLNTITIITRNDKASRI